MSRSRVERDGAPLEIHMLGPLQVSRGGRPLALPASRKVRALLAYVALAQKPVARGPLCELLWDVPNDPRGELRWCLSKIRGLLDDGAYRRVLTRGDTVQLDLSQCLVDVLEVLRATEAGIETLPPERLGALAALFKGEFLESLAIDGSPAPWSPYASRSGAPNGGETGNRCVPGPPAGPDKAGAAPATVSERSVCTTVPDHPAWEGDAFQEPGSSSQARRPAWRS